MSVGEAIGIVLLFLLIGVLLGIAEDIERRRRRVGREITSHKVNECNRRITIEAGPAGVGGAPSMYDVTWTELDGSGFHVAIEFQHGPIAEVGINGLTNEVLLAILEDRMRGLQEGPLACGENDHALYHLQAVREAFHARTQRRLAEGVEGTHRP